MILPHETPGEPWIVYLQELVDRDREPEPWAEGEKIPWHEPGFSARMLAEHLSQAHDLASRRSVVIDRQVAWIHRQVLQDRPSRVLDLGCGPGFYAARLAALGHTCVGIDYGPAAVAHARRASEGLACRYAQEDVRTAEYPAGQDLVMVLFGELNVFPPHQAKAVLHRARAALAPGGAVLVEVSTYQAVRSAGLRPRSWYSAPSGLFSARPHLCLQESFWHADLGVATERWYVIDTETSQVTRHAASTQAYTDEEYGKLLQLAGFRDVAAYPSLEGTLPEAGTIAEGLQVLVARQ